MTSKVARVSIAVSAGIIMLWPAHRGFTEQPETAQPLTAFLADTPQEARTFAPTLQHVVAIFESGQEIRQRVKQLHLDQDAAKTKLTAMSSESELIAQQRQQLEQQLQASETAQQARLDTLRKGLESHLEEELTLTHRQIIEQQDADFARRVQVFETHQREAIGSALDQEFQLKERELQQLSQEIEAQTQELIGRLARLEAGSDVADALQRSTSQTLAGHKAELEARRAALAGEREALLGKQRDRFTGQLKQQQAAGQQRRLIIKEASLRQAMAELLRKTAAEDVGRSAQLRATADGVAQRAAQLAQQQTVLQSRLESLDRALASDTRRMGDLDADRQTSLSRLEAALQRSNVVESAEALAWFGRALQSFPPELATDLGFVRQRLLARAGQERQLAEQRRVLRERQLAMQLSHQMESEFHEAELKRQREQDARARKAEELIGKAEQLAGRGRYDEALQLVAQAQALSPPQLSRVAILREQLVAAKEDATRQAQSVEIEQSFARAMDVFKQGRYEDAVVLFEKVIASEAAEDGDASVQLANRTRP